MVLFSWEEDCSPPSVLAGQLIQWLSPAAVGFRSPGDNLTHKPEAFYFVTSRSIFIESAPELWSPSGPTFSCGSGGPILQSSKNCQGLLWPRGRFPMPSDRHQCNGPQFLGLVLADLRYLNFMFYAYACLLGVYLQSGLCFWVKVVIQGPCSPHRLYPRAPLLVWGTLSQHAPLGSSLDIWILMT